MRDERRETRNERRETRDAKRVIYHAFRITLYALRITHFASRITHFAFRITIYEERGTMATVPLKLYELFEEKLGKEDAKEAIALVEEALGTIEEKAKEQKIVAKAERCLIQTFLSF